jgi:hypothetical protein
LNATLGPSSAIYNDASLTGESLFHEPSVFSYFSPQYRVTGGLLGPEFQIYSTATSTERANLVNGALFAKLDKSTTVDLSPFERTAVAPSFLINYISQVFLHSSMSAGLEQAVTDAMNAASEASAGNPEAMVQAALYVVLTSGEYQIIQ